MSADRIDQTSGKNSRQSEHCHASRLPLSFSCVAIRTHLLRQQLGLLHVTNAVIGSFFRHCFSVRSQRGQARYPIAYSHCNNESIWMVVYE